MPTIDSFSKVPTLSQYDRLSENVLSSFFHQSDSYPRRLGSKRKRYHCAMPSLHPITWWNTLHVIFHSRGSWPEFWKLVWALAQKAPELRYKALVLTALRWCQRHLVAVCWPANSSDWSTHQKALLLLFFNDSTESAQIQNSRFYLNARLERDQLEQSPVKVSKNLSMRVLTTNGLSYFFRVCWPWYPENLLMLLSCS